MPFFKPNIAALKAKRDTAGIVQALQDKDSRTRADALTALGELGDPRALPALVEWLLADEQQLGEKIKAADALGKIGAAAAIAPLLKAHHVSLRRERALIEEAQATPDRRYRIEFYVNRISADEYQLRTTLAHALARIGGVEAVQALFEMLATEKGAMEASVHSAIRAAITHALKRADAQIVPMLCGTLEHPSAQARYWAAHCLGELGETSASGALLRAASQETEDFSVREVALISLGKVGDENALAQLEELTRSGNRSVARNAKACAAAIRQRLGLASLIGF